MKHSNDNHKLQKYLAPVYAMLQGLALGGISVILNAQFGGIALEAICLTALVDTYII